jgi:hypothetical protein
MAEILHLSALLPAAVSACCTAGAARSRGAWAVISAVVMLAAMLDLAGGGVLPPLAWSVLLVALAMGGAVAARIARATGPDPMAAHAALGLVVMAGLVVLMAAGANAPGAGSALPGGHAQHTAGAGPLAGTVWAGTAAYLAYSAVLVGRRAARRAHVAGAGMGGAVAGIAGPRAWRRDDFEIAGMAASVALMAAALLA